MKRTMAWSILIAIGAAPATVFGGSHLWRFNEFFSTADGTIQFVELVECCGATAEHALGGKWVRSVDTLNQFNFPANLTGNTANRHLLLGTAAFAALPGAPTPDHIVPAGFFDINGDTMEYWMYGPATHTFGAGELPTDGVMSLALDGSTAVNSPTNYNGDSGSVNAGPTVPAASTWGLIVLTGLLIAVGGVIVRRRRGVTA